MPNISCSLSHTRRIDMRMHGLWKPRVIVCLALVGLVGGLASCNSSDDDTAQGPRNGGPATGPANPGSPPAHTLGNATNGQTVFRAETFGNERFWTDAIRLPTGIAAAGVTPLQALAGPARRHRCGPCRHGNRLVCGTAGRSHRPNLDDSQQSRHHRRADQCQRRDWPAGQGHEWQRHD